MIAYIAFDLGLSSFLLMERRACIHHYIGTSGVCLVSDRPNLYDSCQCTFQIDYCAALAFPPGTMRVRPKC